MLLSSSPPPLGNFYTEELRFSGELCRAICSRLRTVAAAAWALAIPCARAVFNTPGLSFAPLFHSIPTCLPKGELFGSIGCAHFPVGVLK